MKILDHREFVPFGNLCNGSCFVDREDSINKHDDRFMMKIERVKTKDNFEANAINLEDGSLHLINDDREVQHVNVDATVKEMKHYD